MTQYIISKDLRDSLIGLLILLQNNSEKTYHRFSNRYTNRIILENGKELKLPFLKDLQKDLETLEEVIEEKDYDAKAEEFILIAKEMGLL